MGRGDTAAAQPMREAKIEVRRIDTEKKVGRLAAEAIIERATDAQQLRQPQDGVDKAHDREALHGIQRLHSLGLHLWAANAHNLDITGKSPERGDTARTQGVPGRLTCHHRYAKRCLPDDTSWTLALFQYARQGH